MKKIFSLIGIFLVFQFAATAQFDRLQKKLEERAAKKAAEKFEEKRKEKAKEKGKKKKPLFDLGKAMGGEMPADLEESYDFDFQIDWLIHSSDAEEPIEMSQLYATEKKHMGMETRQENEAGEIQTFYSVLDFDKNYFLILNPENSQVVVLEFQNIEDQVAEQVEEEQKKPPQKAVVTKTDDEKNIAGYPCVRYTFLGEDEEGEFWTTEALTYENFDMYTYFQRVDEEQGAGDNSLWNSGMEGFMLQMLSVDEQGNRTEMIATLVDEQADRSYTLDGYQAIDLRGLSTGLGGFKN